MSAVPRKLTRRSFLIASGASAGFALSGCALFEREDRGLRDSDLYDRSEYSGDVASLPIVAPTGLERLIRASLQLIKDRSPEHFEYIQTHIQQVVTGRGILEASGEVVTIDRESRILIIDGANFEAQDGQNAERRFNNLEVWRWATILIGQAANVEAGWAPTSESRYRQAQLQMDFLVEAGGHSALVAEIEQSTTNALATWEHEMSQVEVLPQTPVPASPIAHFPSLIDQAPESVEEIVGTPVQFGLWGSAGDDESGVWTIKSTGKNAEALVGIYLDRQLEVLYIEGKARRLKLWLRAYRLLYPTDRALALAAAGLDNRLPARREEQQMVWSHERSMPGLYRVWLTKWRELPLINYVYALTNARYV